SVTPTTRVLAPEILCVEDDPDAGDLLEMIFRKEGYRVQVVTSMADALSALERYRSWALIIVDYNLPDGTGTEMLREARRRS
ncbi:response regulator, partial [Salmonella sp. SAL4443]|uniref:response regulator n=1 Tax=Salmonella sp. SAL4443 TaxID=3159898 RepID=UPI00397D60A5